MDISIVYVMVSLFIFLLLSLPIGVAIGLSVLIGIWTGNISYAFIIQKLFTSLDNFPILAVPFFIMAGEIMMKGGMAQRLLDLSRCLVGHITGGLAQVTVLTSMFFGALSGSAPATTAAVGGIMIPSMKKEGYDLPFATSVSTAAGCVGVMIPPSVPLIIYGTTAGVSVGSLFIAGIIPGIFVGLVLMLTSYILAKRKGYTGAGQCFDIKKLPQALLKSIHALLVPVIILGGIYGGIFTPTEAGAVAVVYALFMEGLIVRSLSLKICWDILRKTALTTASIFLVVATATALGQIFLFHNVPDLMVEFLIGISENKYVVILIIIVFLLVMGTFMDALANILILTPLLLPVVKHFGMDPIHFGIVMIVTISMGFITPPVGVNLFVGCGISKISIERLSFAMLPFLIAMLIALLFLIFIPYLSLALL